MTAMKLVFVPPQNDSTRLWATRLAAAVPETNVLAPES